MRLRSEEQPDGFKSDAEEALEGVNESGLELSTIDGLHNDLAVSRVGFDGIEESEKVVVGTTAECSSLTGGSTLYSVSDVAERLG